MDVMEGRAGHLCEGWGVEQGSVGVQLSSWSTEHKGLCLEEGDFGQGKLKAVERAHQ